MMTDTSTIACISEKSKKKELLSLLSKKNKVLIDFYKSCIFLEDSLGIINKSIDLIKEQDEENANEIALSLILKEAYCMNEVFTKVVQKTSFN